LLSVGFEPALAGGSLPIGYCLAFGEAIASPLARDPLFSGVHREAKSNVRKETMTSQKAFADKR
jgi:hypothetical protein